MLLMHFLLLFIAAIEYGSCEGEWGCNASTEEMCHTFCNSCFAEDKCSSDPCSYLGHLCSDRLSCVQIVDQCECLPLPEVPYIDNNDKKVKRIIPRRGFASFFLKLHPMFSRASLLGLPTSAARARRIGNEFTSEFLGKRSGVTASEKIDRVDSKEPSGWSKTFEGSEFLGKRKPDDPNTEKRMFSFPNRFTKTFWRSDISQKTIKSMKEPKKIHWSSEFLGKRNTEMLGKRNSEFLGKRNGEFLGKRYSEFLGKRNSEFLGKRGFDPRSRPPSYASEFLGKRLDSSYNTFGEPEYSGFVKNVSDSEELSI